MKRPSPATLSHIAILESRGIQRSKPDHLLHGEHEQAGDRRVELEDRPANELVADVTAGAHRLTEIDTFARAVNFVCALIDMSGSPVARQQLMRYGATRTIVTQAANADSCSRRGRLSLP